jgi:hypothetical protein
MLFSLETPESVAALWLGLGIKMRKNTGFYTYIFDYKHQVWTP